MSKKLITAVAAATLGAVAFTAPAMAEVSATGGLVSQYVFRGNVLGDAAANGSLDYTNSGFTVGVWAIDDGSASPEAEDGLEVDAYLSYGGDINDDASYSIGLTRYEYTGNGLTNFEQEANLSVSFKGFSLGADIGEGDPNVSGVDAEDYTHISLAWAPSDTYSLMVASFDADDDGAGTYFTRGDYEYAEATAAGTVAELDVSFTVGVSSDDLVGNSDDGYMVLSASKSFDL